MPTFENTMVRPRDERVRCSIDVARTFYTVSSADATAEIQEIDEKLAPLMAAHQDAIQLDARCTGGSRRCTTSSTTSSSTPSSATWSSGTSAR